MADAIMYDSTEPMLVREDGTLPDIIDVHGRTWSWWKGSLWRHDQLAWTRYMIMREDVVLPSQTLRDNPNYDLCSICTQDWTAA